MYSSYNEPYSHKIKCLKYKKTCVWLHKSFKQIRRQRSRTALLKGMRNLPNRKNSSFTQEGKWIGKDWNFTGRKRDYKQFIFLFYSFTSDLVVWWRAWIFFRANNPHAVEQFAWFYVTYWKRAYRLLNIWRGVKNNGRVNPACN